MVGALFVAPKRRGEVDGRMNEVPAYYRYWGKAENGVDRGGGVKSF